MIRIILAFAAVRLTLVMVVLILPPAERPRTISGQGLAWQNPAPVEDPARPYLISKEPLLDLLVRHDGTYYLQIAAFGYTDPQTYVGVKEGFFPGYPYLIRVVHRLFPQDDPKYWLIAAGLLSNACALLAALMIFLTAQAWVSREVAQCTAIAFLVQPFGGVSAVALTESLFVLLTTSMLWLVSFALPWLRTRATKASVAITVAAALAGAAAFTRPPGVVLGLYLIFILWRNRPERLVHWIWPSLALALTPLGFALALWQTGHAAGDFTLWFKVQSAYGHASFPTFDGLQQLLQFSRLSGIDCWRTLLQLITLVIYTLLILTVGLSPRFKALRPQLIWILPAFLLPVLAGGIISLPRYSVVLWPLLIPYASWIAQARPGTKWLLFVLSLLLQASLFWTLEAHWPLLI